MLFDKQFGFQLNNSREYATLQLVNDISSSFKKGKYTLGIFIELPTISKLLEDCYLCTSMGKLITKACWIILLYIYYFSNRNTELEQQSRAITREKPTPGMQKRTIRKLSKPFLYYNNSSATYRLILSGHIETNPGLPIVITSKTNQILTAYHCLPVTYAIRQYKNSKTLMCIHC